ncbi:MAG TPA: serine protease [Chitinophagaceae bacterium]|nr:serine protease [Chitinophagaceae bacterium]
MLNSTTTDELEMLVNQVRDADPELWELVNRTTPAIKGLRKGRADPEKWRFAIILARSRPAYTIVKNSSDIKFNDRDPESQLWINRLSSNIPLLTDAFRAVGRIDDLDDPSQYFGTGWFIKGNIIVTAAHVARAFASGEPGKFVLKIRKGSAMRTAIDTLHEEDSDETCVFTIKEVLHINARYDFAFLRIGDNHDNMPRSLDIDTQLPPRNTPVITIGYPRIDKTSPYAALIGRIFGTASGVKRIAPGMISEYKNARVLHNCTTLEGNSGSPVIELATGRAVALHVSGSFGHSNYAEPLQVIEEELRKFGSDIFVL